MPGSNSRFMLGLLMLTVGCVTAHSPVRREFTVQADGNVEESQTHSLLGQLASMLPEEEAQQAESLLMLAKEGAPKDELMKVIGDLKSKIEPWRTDALATLQKSIDAVRACTTTMEAGVAKWPEKKSHCNAESASHTSCRERESKKYENMMHWKAQTAEKKEIMDTECKVFDDVKKEVRAAKASYGSGNVESYLEGVCADFGALKPRYEDAKKKCASAKAEHAKASKLYETAESEHTAEKAACNEKQTETEVSWCQYSLTTKDTCDTYGTCHDDKVAEYEAVKKIVQSEEKGKKIEYRVYSRIECLLPILGTDNADAIEECRKKTYSLGDIAYPDVPGKDSCSIDGAYPGTDVYYAAQMAPLPADAKGAPVAKCVGLSASSPVVAQASCKPKSTSTGDAGYNDGYRGWYDVQGCGKCLDYCRWVGNSGSGGSPLTKLTHGSSWWSCRLAGDSATYSGKDHFSSWSYAKCSGGEGAEAQPQDTYVATFSENDMNGWNCGAIQTCGDLGAICGGYKQKGKDSSIERSVNLAAGTYKLALDFIKVDSWDGEEGEVYVNGKKCWSSGPLKASQGAQKCGSKNAHWNEETLPVECKDIGVNEGEPLKIKVTSTLDQNSGDESFGISNVKISSQVDSSPVVVVR